MNWQHLCHAIDPPLHIDFISQNIATLQEKSSENHDSSLISDFQLILIIDLLWEKVVLFFFLNVTAIASWPTSPDPHTTWHS